jgi:hypothetical protein
MDLLGGLSNGVTAPGKTWTLAFSPGSPGTGLGRYAIDPSTPFGASDSGDFLIFYDEFSADPNTCGSLKDFSVTMRGRSSIASNRPRASDRKRPCSARPGAGNRLHRRYQARFRRLIA